MSQNSNNERIMHYDGLYREEGAKLSDFVFLETISARSEQFDWQIKPHFHSKLYQCFYVEKGSAEVRLAEKVYCFQAPFLVFVPPTFSHAFHFDSQVSGWVFTFSEQYITSARQQIILSPSLVPGQVICLDAIQDEMAYLHQYFQRVGVEIHQRRDYRMDAVRLLIGELLIFLNRKNLSPNNAQETNNSLLLYRKFRQLILAQTFPQQSLEHFAELLHISKGHLNRICRHAVDLSALQVIQGIIIEQACEYLQYTHYAVNEIALKLGFDDTAYFIRLFKKKTGTTPAAYRQQMRSGEM